MAGWVKKIWKDRKSEYPTRRKLTKTDGTNEIVTVSREEGQISQEGDAFSAANMNDLETRIGTAFDEVNGKLSWKYFGSTDGYNTSADLNLSSIWDGMNELKISFEIQSSMYITIYWMRRDGTGNFMSGYYFDDKFNASVGVSINITQKTVKRLTSWTKSVSNGTVNNSLRYWVYYR